MKLKTAMLSCASAVVLGASAIGAQAQDSELPLDVSLRQHPEYEPTGIRAGSYLLFPKLVVAETYDSNIFAAPDNEESDFITDIIPSISAESNWNNHALNFDAFADFGLYADNSGEDYQDYGVGADGRLDIQRNFYLFGDARFDHLHEDRGTANAVNGTEPTEYDEYGPSVGLFYSPGRVSLTGEAYYTELDYDDVPRVGGGVINNDDRDRADWGFDGRVGYDIQENYEAFVRGGWSKRDYDQTPDDNGFFRSSDGYYLDGGLAFRITGTLVGEAYVGYIERDYSDARFSDVEDVHFGGELLWSITSLTSMKATVERGVQETISFGSSSFVQTGISAEVDHELRRNILLGLRGSFVNNDYQDITREDDIWQIGVDGEYMFTRNFFAGADVRYRDRDSNLAAFDYDQILVGAFVGAQF